MTFDTYSTETIIEDKIELNRTIKNMVRQRSVDKNWIKNVDHVTKTYNNSWHESIKMSPVQT